RGEAHHGVQVAHAAGGHRPGLLGAQQLLQRHRAAGGLLPPGHAGVSSCSAVTYRATCEAPSCHCPASLCRTPPCPGAAAPFCARATSTTMPWSPSPPLARTSVLTQGTAPAARRGRGAGTATTTATYQQTAVPASSCHTCAKSPRFGNSVAHPHR